MVGSTPRLSLRRRPVHAMQEGARDEHRSDAHEEAEDPADLDQVRQRAKRMGEQAKRTKKATKWSQPRSSGRTCGVAMSGGITEPLTTQP